MTEQPTPQDKSGINKEIKAKSTKQPKSESGFSPVPKPHNVPGVKPRKRNYKRDPLPPIQKGEFYEPELSEPPQLEWGIVPDENGEGYVHSHVDKSNRFRIVPYWRHGTNILYDSSGINRIPREVEEGLELDRSDVPYPETEPGMQGHEESVDEYDRQLHSHRETAQELVNQEHTISQEANSLREEGKLSPELVEFARQIEKVIGNEPVLFQTHQDGGRTKQIVDWIGGMVPVLRDALEESGFTDQGIYNVLRDLGADYPNNDKYWVEYPQTKTRLHLVDFLARKILGME